jgi:hypothetical protein
MGTAGEQLLKEPTAHLRNESTIMASIGVLPASNCRALPFRHRLRTAANVSTFRMLLSGSLVSLLATCG